MLTRRAVTTHFSRTSLRQPTNVSKPVDAPKARGDDKAGQEEAGSILILALVYIVSVGLIVGALATWAMNDLNNTAKFTSARSLQYAASSATEVAVQSMRYTPLLSAGQTLNAGARPSYCWGNSSPSQISNIDGYSVAVWCSTVFNPGVAATRVVTFSTCLSGVDNATCATSPLLQAVVTFDDYPATGNAQPMASACTWSCGKGMTVNEWAWSPPTA